MLERGQALFQIEDIKRCGCVGHTLFLIPCLPSTSTGLFCLPPPTQRFLVRARGHGIGSLPPSTSASATVADRRHTGGERTQAFWETVDFRAPESETRKESRATSGPNPPGPPSPSHRVDPGGGASHPSGGSSGARSPG